MRSILLYSICMERSKSRAAELDERLRLERAQRIREALAARAAVSAQSFDGRKPTISYNGAEMPVRFRLASKIRNN